MMKVMKQFFAGVLVMTMVIVGITYIPLKADATDTTETVVKETDSDGDETGVIYVLDDINYKFSDYWTTDSKIAPTKNGYVFGGWYTQEDNVFTAVKESEGSQVTSAYAKFVPAEVLSVRAQLEADTSANNGTTEDGKTYLRLLSAVSGTDYQNAGFDIWYNKTIKEDESTTVITKVYQSITNGETGSSPITPESKFGTAATHFSVLRIADIESVNYGLVIYVNPYWTTLDGTRVEGQAKYLRVIDGYENHKYISVPVNFYTGSDVAAGIVELTYNSEYLNFVGVDSGMLMTDMVCTDNEEGTIKFIGNISGTTDVDPTQDIYANVWFQVDSKVTIPSGTTYLFKIQNLSFCDMNEKLLTDIAAWDVTYY